MTVKHDIAKAATAACLAEIKSAVAQGQTRIAPSLFSRCYGRVATSAAFRMARAQNIIEVAYTSMVGTPVYQAYGVKEALLESAVATIN